MSSKTANKVKDLIDKLDSEDVIKVMTYVSSLLEVDKEALSIKEEQSIEILGFNPSDTLPDHEWEAMLKRDKMSQEKENRE